MITYMQIESFMYRAIAKAFRSEYIPCFFFFISFSCLILNVIKNRVSERVGKLAEREVEKRELQYFVFTSASSPFSHAFVSISFEYSAT